MKPVPCQHIADYYQRLYEGHHCIAFNFLRRGYSQWARGEVYHPAVNNLYSL